MPLIRSMLPRLLEPLPAFVEPLRVLFDDDDEAAAVFIALVVSFVTTPEEAMGLIESAILTGTPNEAIRRLQDDARLLIRQEPFDSLYTGAVDTVEATTDATITPAVWT